jgi:hypothetical protein
MGWSATSSGCWGSSARSPSPPAAEPSGFRIELAWTWSDTVKRGAALENLTGAIVETCRSGLRPEALRDRVLPRLRRAVPFDAAFWATVDPTTLLFTQPHQNEIPPETVPYFIENEFFDADVNKWTALARDRVGVRTLAQATNGDMDASPRYRDIFRPLGFGDELRAVLRVGGACRGYICLHREAGAPFARQEVDYVHRLAPHLAEGIRAGILVASTELGDVADAPGLVLVAPDGSLSQRRRQACAGSRSSGTLSLSTPDCPSKSTRSLRGSKASDIPRNGFQGLVSEPARAAGRCFMPPGWRPRGRTRSP